MPTDNFKEIMTRQRTALAEMVATAMQTFTEVKTADIQQGQNTGEMCANIMLAVRHLEDAAMRFGKAIQAASGGQSPLGGPDTPGN